MSDILVSSADIRASLGRNLSAGANAFADLPLMAPGTLYADRTNKLDVRLTKIFKFGSTRLQGALDVFNLLN